MNAVEPHFSVSLEYALLTQKLPLPYSRLQEFLAAAHFHGRRWPYVNPLQDAQADILRIEAGLDSPDNVIRNSERGGDAEEVYQEIASCKKSAEKHGLDFSSADPTTPTVKKGEPGEEQPNAEGDESKPKPKKGGKQAKSRINWGRLERTIRILEASKNGH